jgi:uncharacterized membrane protein
MQPESQICVKCGEPTELFGKVHVRYRQASDEVATVGMFRLPDPPQIIDRGWQRIYYCARCLFMAQPNSHRTSYIICLAMQVLTVILGALAISSSNSPLLLAALIVWGLKGIVGSITYVIPDARSAPDIELGLKDNLTNMPRITRSWAGFDSLKKTILDRLIGLPFWGYGMVVYFMSNQPGWFQENHLRQTQFIAAILGLVLVWDIIRLINGDVLTRKQAIAAHYEPQGVKLLTV